MFELKYNTTQEWIDAVMADFPSFLQDHAAAEKRHQAWQWQCCRITQIKQNWLEQ